MKPKATYVPTYHQLHAILYHVTYNNGTVFQQFPEAERGIIFLPQPATYHFIILFLFFSFLSAAQTSATSTPESIRW